MSLRRLVLPGILLVALYFALFGGEYSIFEVRATRRALAEEQGRLTDLRRQIDSLEAWRDSLLTDSATLERIARERFGMIRPGETLYRFTEPQDSAPPDTVGAAIR